ncbi:MAG: AmmeMemoRadiSam system protein B [Chloroflexota bacterium]
METESTNIRPSPIAGTWYSADPAKLRGSIEGYLRETELPDLPGEVIALIVPHAGHRYSGLVAAYAFKSILGHQYDRVAVIAPSHHYYTQAILTSAHQAYETPLGIVPIEQAAVVEINKNLQAELGVGMTAIANDNEHALEIELPFLQCVLLEPFSLIPIMLREQSAWVAQGLSKALAATLQTRNALMVASTDLSHFYPEEHANQLDQAVLAEIAAFNPEGLYALKTSGQGQACGLGAIAAVMWAAKALGADQVTVVNYNTSAAVTHDRSSVVGYGAAVITKST